MPIGEMLLCWWQSTADWHSADETPASTGERGSGDCKGRHLDEHWSETTQGPGMSWWSRIFV